MAARIQRRLGRTRALLASFVIKGVARLKNRTLDNLESETRVERAVV